MVTKLFPVLNYECTAPFIWLPCIPADQFGVKPPRISGHSLLHLNPKLEHNSLFGRKGLLVGELVEELLLH